MRLRMRPCVAKLASRSPEQTVPLLMFLIMAVTLALLVTIPTALILSAVVIAAAPLFLHGAVVPVAAAVRPHATGETDEASHQHQKGNAIWRFHELLQSGARHLANVKSREPSAGSCARPYAAARCGPRRIYCAAKKDRAAAKQNGATSVAW